MSLHLQYKTKIPFLFLRKKPLAMLIIASSTAPTLPQAQGLPPSGVMEEILVMGVLAVSEATTNLEQVYDLPLSQSVIPGDVLDRELALDYEAISKRLANVTFNQDNTRGASLSIRGLGKRAFAEVQDPSVLVVQDGVSFGLTALGNFDFYDVESVESFRGPVGTWGGKGGSSGAVYVNTKKPSFESSTEFSLTYGERDSIIIKGATGGTVIEDLLAWRGSFVVDKGRGSYKNLHNTNYSLYDRNRVSGRIQLLLTPNDQFSARWSLDLEPRASQLQNGLQFFVTPPEFYDNGQPTDTGGNTAKAILEGYYRYPAVGNREWVPARDWFVGREFNGNVYTYDNYIAGASSEAVNFNQIHGQTVSNRGTSLTLDYEFETATLTSVTAVREYTFDAHNDEYTPFDIRVDSGGGVYYRQYSQELIWDAEINNDFEYRAGIFLFKTDNNIISKDGWGPDGGAWYASASQYNRLERDAGVNRGAGLALLHDSVDGARRKEDLWVNTQSNAIYTQASWNWHESAQLTFGLRIGTEDRTTAAQRVIENNGRGAALNEDEARGIPLGGFISDTASGVLGEGNSAGQLALADQVAHHYFGVELTDVPGEAYDQLTAAQHRQVADAKAIRRTRIGPIFGYREAHYDDTLTTALLTQSFELTDGIKVYGTWQYGEKSGSAFFINGESAPVKPEATSSFELGLRSFWFDDTVTLNFDVFRMDIDDYQQAVRAVDSFATGEAVRANPSVDPATLVVYTTAQGNVNQVQVTGLEFDGLYKPFESLSIRFSGAYNDARYKDFQNSPKTPELNYLPEAFIDQSGRRLPGAALWTGNIGAEYRTPAWETEFHASFNTAFTSEYLENDDLSIYSRVPSHSRTDASFGFGQKQDGFDVSIVVKNLFDDTTSEAGWESFTPYPYRRWVGITFSSTF
jgi:iron complex outermembrane receptor protein